MALNRLCLFCIMLVSVTADLNVTVVRDPWIDPTSNTLLTITTNATGPLKVGDVISYTCSAAGLSNPDRNLEWTEVIEDFRIDLLKGSSPLVLKKTILASDNGKQLLCQSMFFNQHGWHVYYYYVHSERIALNVDGVSERARKPNFAIGQTVTMAPVTNNVGDRVGYRCVLKNIPASFMEIRQVKGAYEMKLHAGFQMSRHLPSPLDPSDKGTSVYCLAFCVDPKWNSYAIQSDLISIT